MARCIDSQVRAMNATLYPDSERAVEEANMESANAVLNNAVLDVLDDLVNKEQEWFTVKLEPRR